MKMERLQQTMKKYKELWDYYEQLYGNNGEGNGTALQYSCLENPMDGGAW